MPAPPARSTPTQNLNRILGPGKKPPLPAAYSKVPDPNSKPRVKGHLDKKRVSSMPIVIRVYEGNFNFSVFSQWAEKRLELEDAPEILILFKRPMSYSFNHESIFLRMLTCFGKICQNRIHAYYGLANFKPLIARTNHTIEYVERLMKSYTGPSPTLSGVSVVPLSQLNSTTKVASVSSGKDSNTSVLSKQDITRPPRRHPFLAGSKQQLLQDFYKIAHRTLQYLQNGITLYKQIILSLSFTRYAEENLDHEDAKLVRGKSIIGSCVWLVVYAVQQMQEDPDVEQWGDAGSAVNSKLDPQLFELAAEILSLVTLSFHTWNDMVVTAGVLERIHKKTEVLFHKQTHYFHSVAPPDSEHAIATSVHLKKYRRSESDSLQLRKFDPSTVPLHWGKRHAFPRILYKTDYADKYSAWKGFDPLSVDEKMTHLKELIKFVKLILESVRESAGQIMEHLQGTPERVLEREVMQNLEKQGKKVGSNPSQFIQLVPKEITCYEDGLEAMDEILSKKLSHVDWSPNEIKEFFETDKIFLDDMDLLTLGAGVTRAILHDARRTMHICYETSRLVDFKEFMNLPDYQKVYKTVKDEARNSKAAQPPPGFNSSPVGGTPRRSGDGGSAPTSNPNSARASMNPNREYDIEEMVLEQRNVADLFRNSPYYEIIKTLPIYCSTVGITLQDAELVFTPSSEKLLSRPPTLKTIFD